MVDALELSQILTTLKIEKQTNLNGKRGIMSRDVQTALYILSLLGKKGVMRVNKISYVSSTFWFDSGKSKIHKTPAYLLGV